MKIQLIEAFHGGHHTNYIVSLMPAFSEALSTNRIQSVCITITAVHYDLLIKLGLLQDVHQRITFSPTFPLVSPSPDLMERKQIFDAIISAVATEQPDAMIVPSADYDVMINALFKRRANFGEGKPVRAVGVLHYGYPTNVPLSLTENVKQFVYETSWEHDNWNQYLIVNPIIYEALVEKNSPLISKITLLPDPVPTQLPITKHSARQKLGIPEEGIYLGYIGMIDARKSLPEVLKAFQDGLLYKESRLLLAGQLANEYAQLIHAHYQGLVDSQRIIMINRMLTDEEVQWGYAALDVVTLLQYRRMNLSANLLKAVAYDKPIVADDCGYTGMMVKRFKLGYLCDVEDQESVNNVLRAALKDYQRYSPSPLTDRLKRFHHPNNYANTVMQALLQDNAGGQNLVDWDWVNEGII